jgi:hypothetical protein
MSNIATYLVGKKEIYFVISILTRAFLIDCIILQRSSEPYSKKLYIVYICVYIDTYNTLLKRNILSIYTIATFLSYSLWPIVGTFLSIGQCHLNPLNM